ncbi:MAG: glycosyl transferase family 39 [Pseudonocardia sp.]|nr:glycosyl transferase family 39 [Pseudonocardia sp.]
MALGTIGGSVDSGVLPIGPPRQPPPEPAPAVDRLGPPPPTDRLRGWIVTASVTLLAAVVRFWNLGSPTDKGTPVFDEKHYAPQAWQMLRNGGVEDNPGYELVVHPPLGKQLIAVGEALFGYDGLGWRVSAAVAGTLCVLLIVRATRRMTRSTLLGGIAGILLICDGLSHVQSRIGMLDIFLALFVLGAFTALVCDRDDVRARMARVVAAGRIGDSPFGPRLGVRWWRFAAGAMLGLACAVKWSGIYWVVAFAALCLLWDVTARRAAGVQKPWVGTLVRDAGPVAWAMAAVPLLVYLSSWWAWFGSETAIDRHVIDSATGSASAVAGGGPSFLPDSLRSLWLYSSHVLDFHAHLLTPVDHPHPWESKPWAWPMALRPMVYALSSGSGAPPCGAAECYSTVMLVGTPALWLPALGVAAWSLWRTVTSFDWRYAAVLVGYGAGFLPWFINIDRQMYFFYMTPVAPFLVIGTTLVLGEVLGRARAGMERRTTGLFVVALYVGAVIANFAWLWPILNGDSISAAQYHAELWLPSWK